MTDSDDDVVFVEEVENAKSKKWRWKAPNPKVKTGAVEEILNNVRVKLDMVNPADSPDDCLPTVASSERKSISSVKIHNIEHEIAGPCLVVPAPSVQKTPQKSSLTKAPVSLTPEEILELTENCLDSDNEPDMTPLKFPSSHECIKKSAPKRALNFNVKASSSVRNKASKFFGAGTSTADVEEILSQGDDPGVLSQGSSPSKSLSKSPSPKKKRLSKNSPIRLLPSHRKLGKSPSKLSPVKRKLGIESPAKPQTEMITKPEFMSDGPYYYEAFRHIVKTVCDNPGYKHLFLESELEKVKTTYEAKLELQLYVRLMNRKDKWNRCCDVRYDDITPDLTPLFDFLEDQGLILCDISEEKLDVLLHILKVEELKSLCSQFKLTKTNKKKVDLVESLLRMHRTQPTFGCISPLRKRAEQLLGRCVRLAVEWRLLFRRCILLFSMFHSFGDLDQLSSEQALLLLQVKQGNMVFPLNDAKIKPTAMVFRTRDQLIRFEEARELSQEINIAVESKSLQVAEDLTNKCMMQFASLLELSSETSYVSKLPQFLQKFCAGYTYANALTRSVFALKQKKNYLLALNVLDVLLNQNTYCFHKRGKWAIEKSKILHVNLKRIVEACNVLCSVLKDKSLLSPVDCMHLQERAEMVFKLKQNGLPQKYKDQLQKVMDPPKASPDAVVVNARALSSSKPGLKKVYVRDTDDGREFMSVEETVIAHYKSLGFLCGIHDEGSTISSLCLLSLWDHIYDETVPSVFQSPFQDRPLDWGSKSFYESRKNKMEAHFSELLCTDVMSVASKLNELKHKYGHITSVINWERLERLDILTFLQCISIPVFVAVARRFVEDWKSHRSGFPDLVIWSPPQKKCLFIEVKSPNDTLSTIQCMWLDFLKTNNAKAIVVHIRESGSRNVHSASK